MVLRALLQVGWRMTGQWIAGNLACKVFLFLRAFGPYLSSNVLVCVSLDRYFAVLHPLKVNDARRRGKVLLAFAWGTSFIYCIPQVGKPFIFLRFWGALFVKLGNTVRWAPETPRLRLLTNFAVFLIRS